MLLEIYNQSLRMRNDIIRVYDYVTYTDEFNGVGSFQINIPTAKQSLEFLQYGNFILFEDGVCGIIKKIHDNEEDDTQVIVSGYLTNYILQQRVIPRTERYNGTLTENATSLVINHFCKPDDIFRKIDFVHIATEDEYLPVTEKVSICETGETVGNTIANMFLPYNFGYEMYPIIKDYDEETGDLANLRRIDFRVLKPKDRTIGNAEGNKPVVFSFDLNNVNNIDYEEDGMNYASMAYVASEGVGQYRKVMEVGESERTGYARIEMYVDARDLQSEDEEGKEITEAQLEKLMLQRGLEKLEERQRFITFDGSVIVDGENSYKYGVDFYKGDFVSVRSKHLDRFFNVQIVSVTKSISNGVEFFDIAFGYDNLSMARVTDSKMLFSEKIPKQGNTGATPQVTVGSVSTGTVPIIYDTGTTKKPELNFILPEPIIGGTEEYTFRMKDDGNLYLIADSDKLGDFSVDSSGRLVYNGSASTFRIDSNGYLMQS